MDFIQIFLHLAKLQYINGTKLATALIVAIYVLIANTAFVAAQEGPVFEIKSFLIEGNTLLPEEKLQEAIEEFTGPGKTAEDVEAARQRLEKLYRQQGYGTVLVSIPQQSVEFGIVKLQVFEGRIGKVRVTGNRYFTKSSILREIPSLTPGNIPYIPDLQNEINRVNRKEDIKVVPRLMPGREQGTVDVELVVEDQLPLHGALELNNRSTHDTTDLRLNAKIDYNNLWQRGHTISFQYQTSPEDFDEVQAITGLYMLNAPWNHNHILWVYGLATDSETAFGEGFQTVGTGYVIGGRYLFLLPTIERYNHSAILGIDYKDFNDTQRFGEDKIETPLTYAPFSFSYNASLTDSSGFTELALGLNLVPRGLVSDSEEFEQKRFGAKGNYVYVTAQIGRKQKLFADFILDLDIDGQLADQPLISNEQYSAGGMNSVRGYKETEALGDDALHGTIELTSPNWFKWFGLNQGFVFAPYLFYDVAFLRTKETLPGEDPNTTLQGTGVGVGGTLSKYFQYQVDWGYALEETDRTDDGTSRVYFMVKALF